MGSYKNVRPRLKVLMVGLHHHDVHWMRNDRSHKRYHSLKGESHGQLHHLRTHLRCSLRLAESIRLKGEAEATAINAKGKALRDNPALVALIQAERWNGQLPTTMVPGATVPFMDVNPAKTP